MKKGSLLGLAASAFMTLSTTGEAGEVRQEDGNYCGAEGTPLTVEGALQEIKHLQSEIQSRVEAIANFKKNPNVGELEDRIESFETEITCFQKRINFLSKLKVVKGGAIQAFPVDGIIDPPIAPEFNQETHERGRISTNDPDWEEKAGEKPLEISSKEVMEILGSQKEELKQKIKSFHRLEEIPSSSNALPKLKKFTTLNLKKGKVHIELFINQKGGLSQLCYGEDEKGNIVELPSEVEVNIQLFFEEHIFTFYEQLRKLV